MGTVRPRPPDSGPRAVRSGPRRARSRRYAPRKSLFTDLVTRFRLPSGMAETLLDDYRAGFPSACVLFSDAVQTLSHLHIGPEARADHERLHPHAESQTAMPGPVTLVRHHSDFRCRGHQQARSQIFHRALERLHTNPAQAVFVGDHPEVDVAGARAAGMRAIWRRDRSVTRVVEADGVIDELSDLLAWLGLERTERQCLRSEGTCAETG